MVSWPQEAAIAGSNSGPSVEVSTGVHTGGTVLVYTRTAGTPVRKRDRIAAVVLDPGVSLKCARLLSDSRSDSFVQSLTYSFITR